MDMAPPMLPSGLRPREIVARGKPLADDSLGSDYGRVCGHTHRDCFLGERRRPCPSGSGR